MVSEIVTLEGHIIDSRLLAAVLDDIVAADGEFTLLEVHIGPSRLERSYARIEVRAPSLPQLHELLKLIVRHGAIWQAPEDAELAEADQDGCFPEDFYSTTNQRTYIRHGGEWHEVLDQEMDCGVRLDRKAGTFRCVPITHIRCGDALVCGERGIKVVPLDRPRTKGAFEFMNSEVSTEKPKNTVIRHCARQMVELKRAGKRLALVGGPAIVHTGAVGHVEKLIERGFVHLLLAGNALATHDIEFALYGTSLGVYLEKATLADAGHEHHLRAINTIRRCGGIAKAVERGVLNDGIMHACVKLSIPFILGGSLRDDGPLPDVITDMLVAQDRMRAALRDVGFVLMVATTLHSIAVGNMLPAWIPVVCVDISPSVITKLADRGSFQTVGLVTDVEPFFNELLQEIEALERGAPAKPRTRKRRSSGR